MQLHSRYTMIGLRSDKNGITFCGMQDGISCIFGHWTVAHNAQWEEAGWSSPDDGRSAHLHLSRKGMLELLL